MTISVIIPAYEATGVIDASLASVAAQTVSPDEVIVVDDGSRDGTAAVAERWCDVLPLRVLRLEQNVGQGLGAGGARAAGIEKSTGELIALLDADDVWLPDHLAAMRDEHDRRDGLVTANYYLWVPGAALGTRPASELVPVPPVELQWLRLLDENYVFVSTLFSRSLYERAGGFRNIRCEDWDLWIRMVRHGARVSMPAHVTALYRQAAHSVSGTDKLLVGDIDVLEELLETAAGVEREAILRAVRRRRAKQSFLDGIRRYDAGDTGAARAAWLRALVLDVGLGRSNSRLSGRVAPRAAASILAPAAMMRLRRKRQSDPGFVVGGSTSEVGSEP
jgi:Glycosyl transferase family 2